MSHKHFVIANEMKQSHAVQSGHAQFTIALRWLVDRNDKVFYRF